MSKKTKEQKAQEKLAKLLGMEAPTPASRVEANARSMEAEAALEYFERPQTFSEKNCKQCGQLFATRGAPVAYCSDPCRVKAFEQRMGVKWQPDRPNSERWGFMGEPLTVPPEALSIVQAVLAERLESATKEYLANFTCKYCGRDLAKIDDTWVLYNAADDEDAWAPCLKSVDALHHVGLYVNTEPQKSPDLDADTLDILAGLGLE